MNLFFKFFIFLLTIELCGYDLNISFAQEVAQQSQRPFIKVKPLELDWRKVPWSPITFNHMAIKPGIHTYQFQIEDTERFKCSLIFPTSLYSFDKNQTAYLKASLAFRIRGGIGPLSYEKLSALLSRNSIQFEAYFNSSGKIEISIGGLKQDYTLALQILDWYLHKPQWNQKDFEIWSKDKQNDARAFFEMSGRDQQLTLLTHFMDTEIFGEEHPLAQKINYFSPKFYRNLSLEKIKKYDLFDPEGTIISLAGNKKDINPNLLIKIINKKYTEKQKDIPVEFWYPQRPLKNNGHYYTMVDKEDLTQHTILKRIYFPTLPTLNTWEKLLLDVGMAVFSSPVGVTGSDRLSSKMRGESGTSYIAYSRCYDDFLNPASKLLYCGIMFMSPKDKLEQSIDTATHTWEEFTEKGISYEEFLNSKNMLTNQILTSETTPFDHMEQWLYGLMHNEPFYLQPEKQRLTLLSKIKDEKEINALLKILSKDSLSVTGIIGPSEGKSAYKGKHIQFEQWVKEFE